MQVTKHHALGNDFLVLVDLDEADPIDADVARAICDRHRGIGADGLIRVTPGRDHPFRMELRNEDGSRAEMSGNGISCLAQAVVLGGHAADEVAVDTDAGPRVVTVTGAEGPDTHRMRVAMGTPRLLGASDTWLGDGIDRGLAVDVGNPHVVLHVTSGGPDLVELGERINDATPGGTNVELVRAGDGDVIEMQVYERGVGPTEACGTGCVAAAAAALEWGIAPPVVTVAQPGGDAGVELGDPAHLTVPAVAIATIEWPW